MKEKCKCIFVDINSDYYKQAVKIRYKVFFEPNGVSIEVVYDNIENSSSHLVAIKENTVVGYIRLTIENSQARISQFVVSQEFRGGLQIGKMLVDTIIAKAKEEQVSSVFGEVRLHVAKAAKLYGFNVSDEIIYSSKTGIPHKRIEKIIP